MEHIVTVAVSDSNSDEESTLTHDLVSTEPYGAMDVQLSDSALVQLDDFSADVPDTCLDASNSLFNIPQDVESSLLPDSSAFDLAIAKRDSDSSGNEHTSEPEGVTHISSKEGLRVAGKKESKRNIENIFYIIYIIYFLCLLNHPLYIIRPSHPPQRLNHWISSTPVNSTSYTLVNGSSCDVLLHD